MGSARLGVFAVCIVALAGCKSTDDKPKPPPQSSKELRLRSRTVRIGEGIDRELAGSLTEALERDATPRVMMRLRAPLGAVERADLELAGVRLVGYLGANTWLASVRAVSALRFAEAEISVRVPVLGSIQWMGEILSSDKITPRLRERGVAASARTGDGQAALVVYHYEDADPDRFRTLLDEHGAEVVARMRPVSSFRVNMPESGINALAAEHDVRWIEPVPPIGRSETTRERAFLQVDVAFTSGMRGDGVVVAVIEEEHAKVDHPELNGDVFQGDADPYSPNHYHPTASAAFITGSGVGGSKYRGMAPDSTVYTYDYWVGDADYTTHYANYTGDLEHALDTTKASIVNNSWGTPGCVEFPYGLYEGLCDDLDAAVRGDGYGRPAVIVFSAGNERDGYWDGTAVNTDCLTDKAAPFINYRTMNHPKSAKNTIVVGAVDSSDDRMTLYSSWGPTEDGRIKPEVVAGGQHGGVDASGMSNATEYANAYETALYNQDYPEFDYGAHSMTSAASAAVSGAIALLVEQWREKMRTPLDPLPSTVKALLIQTARDLDDGTAWFHPGPDYASGFGVIQIKDAIDLIGSGKHVEGKLLHGEEHDYTVQLGPGAARIRVSLAWDDPAADPLAAAALVNDLDLELIDPLGNVHHPWTLDPADPAAPAVRTTADHVNNIEQVLVDGGGLTAGSWTVRVKGTTVPEGPQRYSLVADRLLVGSVDAIAVLDRSGSMSGAASSGMPDTKIEVLREAVSLFVDVMEADVGNRFGMVQFQTNVVPFASPPDADLSPLTTSRRNDLKTVTIPSITQGGRTSIGDGLRAALNQFPAPAAGPATPRSILLVTDGKENEPEWIADVKQDLIDAGVGVYSLGLGYGSGVDEEKLTELSAATGATYRITSDHLVFRKLFLEALGGAADWSLIVDPVDVIGPGSKYTIPVQVSRDEHLITFAAYWEGVDEAIALQLITPSGTPLQAKLPIRGVRYGSARHYAFVQLDLPLGGSFASEWEGTWQMQLTGTARIEDGQQVRYSASALAEGGAKFEAAFDRPVYATGDTVRMRARLTRSGRPLRGAKVVVLGDVPGAAIGTLLSESKLVTDATDLNGDPLNLADRKLHALLKAKPMPRDQVSFALHDDGQHGDGKPNDGVYSGTYTDTKFPGSYTFRFLAAGIPAGGKLTTTREWTGSFYTKVKVERKYSDCTVRALAKTAQGRSFRVSATPRDAHKNLLGPGHAVALGVVDGKSRRVVDLADQGNGSYSSEVLVTPAELDGDLVLHVLVDGKQLARFEKPKEGTRK